MTVPYAPEVGAVFGGEFRIVRPLRAGGMGAVYVAEQASTGKLRALKLMHPQLVADTRLRERFEQEARASGLIPSDHVVQVIAAGIDATAGVPWLAMELLEGEDLATRLKRTGVLPPDQVYEIFRQLCHALGAAHRSGVIHRDLKPENIYLAKTQSATQPISVKVLDFGIAKVASEASTMATASLGTPLWMAPEQTEARGRISPATDIWALGLIAFAALTGRVYWRAANDPMGVAMPVLLREILIEPLDAASTRAGALGRAGCVLFHFDPWFARCVAREPAARFATTDALFEAMHAALFGPRAGVSSVAITPPHGSESATPATDPAFSATGPTAYAGTPPTAALPSTAAPPPSGTPPPIGSVAASASATPTRASARPRAMLLASACVVVVGFAVAGALMLGGARGARSRLARKALVPARPVVVVPSGEPAPSQAPAAADSTPLPAGLPTPTRPKPRSSVAPRSAPAPSGAPAPQPSAPAPRPFDAARAHEQLQQVGATAKVHCRNTDGPKSISATVYFNPSGAVQRINVDPRVAGTPSALCMRMQLSRARVPPFDGDQLASVTTTTSIE